MALPVKKVYVDTAYKTPDSRGNSDFRFELPESLTLPDNCVCYIDDVCVPHAWRTVETGINDRLYIQVSSTEPNEDIRPNEGFIVALSSRMYSGADLAVELQAGLNSAVSYVSDPFVVSFDAARHEIAISTVYADVTFLVLTSNDLLTLMGGQWLGPNYDARNPSDVNGEILKQTEGSGVWRGFNNPWVSGGLSLQPVRSVYLHSPNVGHFNAIGPNGESSILKVIPVTAGPGCQIFDQVVSGIDYVDCSRQSLRTLEFQIRDVYGNLIPFHGSNLSFSLVFDVLDVQS